jgi:hypothetical protein
MFSLPNLIFAQSHLINESKVDSVEIGMEVDELYTLYESNQLDLIDMRLEATYSPAYLVKDKGGNNLFFAEIDCSTIWRIKVVSPFFKTDNGIGVGQTVADLKKKYGELEIIKGETDLFLSSEMNKLSFAVDCQGSMFLDSIPESAKIKFILVL